MKIVSHFQRVNLKKYYTFLSEFISNNTETFREILTRKTLFHMKQCWHFQRATTKQYYTRFSVFISDNTFSGSYYKIIHIFSEFIWNNIYTCRVITKQSCKKMLFWRFLKTDIFREFLISSTDFSTDDVPGNNCSSLRCDLIQNIYWLG